MSRIEEFDDLESEQDSLRVEEDYRGLVSVKEMLSQANPLMNKIEFTPQQPKSYYPLPLGKLPEMLNHHEYHIDRNNMVLMDEAVFGHEKMKKDLARCWGVKQGLINAQLQTLKEFYQIKSALYQKYPTSNSNYFATYNLNRNNITSNRDSCSKTTRNGFIIRSTRTPLITDRSKTERVMFRPQINFDSNFQSGNLFKVFEREHNEYDLILQNDINTRGNNQWFFFRVKNVPKGTTVKFNIVNMSKRYSLFDYGMKPSVFSMMKYQKRKVGWVRDGTKVHYQQSNQLRRERSNCPYFSLSFEYRFTYDGDIVYFSYSIPYTFSNLNSFLTNTISEQNLPQKLKARSLGHTLGVNETTLIELTNFENKKDKKSIWILGRQHSGEVTSSFMIEGIISYLLSGCKEAEHLMNNFVFRVVPMLNIDGVIHGNSRAGLSGYDSNRKWGDPSKYSQPIVWTIKKMIEHDRVEMILDLHSHSRKLGTFFYCNSAPQYSNAIKIFPMLVCKRDERFDFRSNRFRGGNDLTARRVFYELLNIPYIYTIESSLYGYQKEDDFRIIPYQPQDYRQMAQSVLCSFSHLIIDKQTVKDQRLLICPKQQLQQEDNLWDIMNQVDQIQSVGSDEDPAGDQLSKKQLDAIFEVKPKKLKKKKRKESVVKLRKKEEIKKEDDSKTKKNDQESVYRRFFSGRTSLNNKQASALFQAIRPKPEMRNFGCQVEVHQSVALHRSSLHNVQNTHSQVKEKPLLPKGLCVMGQKVEDGLVILGNTVGLQVEMERVFMRSRKEVLVQNKSVPKRWMRASQRVESVKLQNTDNFLNKGDILHKALRMLKSNR